MSDADDDLDFELVTSAKQLAAAPPLRHEKVTVADWKTTSGKAARFLVWELTAAVYAEFLESGRIYKDGALKRYDVKDEDVRLLAFTVCDQHGNRLWSTVEAAKTQLGGLGKASLNLLLNAANEVNSAKPTDTEGNSGGTPSDSSPTT
jgi:hypothetical protein